MASEASALERPIGREAPLFFMHVPKTAGTTLLQLVEQRFDEARIARWLYPTTVIAATPEFFRAHRYFHGHVERGLMHRRLVAPITLTMLREPVERVLSNYGNHRRAADQGQVPDVPADQFEQFRRTGLREFLFDPPARVVPLAANFHDLQSKFLATEYDPAGWPELAVARADGRYVYPAPDLVRAMRALDGFAFVGLAERFQESLFLLAYTFGWPPVVEYRSINVGRDRPRQETLPPDVLERLIELNGTDRQLYAHGRRLFEARYARMTEELLDRYGRREHAHMRPPVPAEVVAELLDRHYTRRFVERQPAVTALRLCFDQAISGLGWDVREPDPAHGVYRWSGPGRRATLDLPIDASADRWLKISVAMAITPEVLASLRVSVNGHTIDPERTPSGGSMLLEGSIPRAVLARRPGCARVDLEVAQTVKPCTFMPGSADDRALGIAVNWVEVGPVLRTDRAPPRDSDRS